eukprot:1278170-Rhodomonas_salina.6
MSFVRCFQAQKQKPPTGKTPTPNKPMAWASIPSPPQVSSRSPSRSPRARMAHGGHDVLT